MKQNRQPREVESSEAEGAPTAPSLLVVSTKETAAASSTKSTSPMECCSPSSWTTNTFCHHPQLSEEEAGLPLIVLPPIMITDLDTLHDRRDDGEDHDDHDIDNDDDDEDYYHNGYPPTQEEHDIDNDTFTTLSTQGSLPCDGEAAIVVVDDGGSGTDEAFFLLLPDWHATSCTAGVETTDRRIVTTIDDEATNDVTSSTQTTKKKKSSASSPTTVWEAMANGDDAFFTAGFVSVGPLPGSYTNK